MALPDLDLCKAVLKIENTAEDTLVAFYLTSAIAMVETFIRRPIFDPDGERNFGPVRVPYSMVRGLRISDQAPNDRMQFSTWDALGRSTNLPDSTAVLGSGPLSALPDYQARWEPLVSQAILDTVAELYGIRNPMVQYTMAGGGVNEQYAKRVGGLSPRVRALLQPLYALSAV